MKITGIIDYGAVTRKLAELSEQKGAELLLSTEVLGIKSSDTEIIVEHSQGVRRGTMLANASGLHSDRIAAMAALEPSLRIIPFRGEVRELSQEACKKVKGSIYPVPVPVPDPDPDPALPFLGAHFTKMVDGGVHAGPNAVLALAREGYSWGAVNIRDVWSTLSYPGFTGFAAQNFHTGIQEVVRLLSPSLFARDLSKLVPGIRRKNLVRAEAGVRAQAVGKVGKLVDDFVIQRTKNQVHTLNAPSPAATAPLAIAEYIVSSLEQD